MDHSKIAWAFNQAVSSACLMSISFQQRFAIHQYSWLGSSLVKYSNFCIRKLQPPRYSIQSVVLSGQSSPKEWHGGSPRIPHHCHNLPLQPSPSVAPALSVEWMVGLFSVLRTVPCTPGSRTDLYTCPTNQIVAPKSLPLRCSGASISD